MVGRPSGIYNLIVSVLELFYNDCIGFLPAGGQTQVFRLLRGRFGGFFVLQERCVAPIRVKFSVKEMGMSEQKTVNFTKFGNINVP